MKSIICFKKGDYDNGRFWYDKAMEAHGGEPEGYTGIFMTYAEIYHHAIDGHLQEALKITDSIKSLKERYLIKCDLYQYGGEMDKAFDTQHQLLLLNDSIRGTMMAENISQMEHDLQAYPMIVRCHRAFLVNLGQVDQIISNAGSMQLRMKHTNECIPVSRSNMSQIKDALKNISFQ